MAHNTYLYILVMAAVTFLVRVLPLTLIRREIKNRFIRSFLYYVPYVTLAVMTFPAILSATASPISGLAALLAGIAARKSHARHRRKYNHAYSHAEQGHRQLPEMEGAGQGRDRTGLEVQRKGSVDEHIRLSNAGSYHARQHENPHATGIGIRKT